MYNIYIYIHTHTPASSGTRRRPSRTTTAGQSPYYDSGFQRVRRKHNFTLKGGILMFREFPRSSSQAILVGTI